MGRDKLSLEVGGAPIVLRAYEALDALCEEVLVVGPGGEKDLAVGTRRIRDLRPGGEGPLAGMEAGFAAARYPLVFVLAGDMPFVPEALVEYLLECVANRRLRAAVPKWDGPHPLCAAYDREILPLMRRALDGGARAVREFLDGLDGVEYVEKELRRFGDPDLFLMNVNTPEDLERARAVLRNRQG